MIGEIDLTQILRASLNIPFAVGDWQNSFKFQHGFVARTDSYNLLILLDFDHLFYHVGIGISTLDGDFSTEIDALMIKVSGLAQNIAAQHVNGARLHFTRKVFIATNKATFDLEMTKRRFDEKGLSLTVYELEKDKLKVVSEKNIYAPSTSYHTDVIEGKKKLAFGGGNYSIWEHEDGSVSYTFQVMQQSDIITNRDRLASLTSLSPARARIGSLVHGKKQKKSIQASLGSAMNDTFEGHVDEALQSLEVLENKLKRSNFFRNVGLSLVLGLFSIASVSSLLFVPLSIDKTMLNAAIFGMTGSIVSLFIPLEYLKRTVTYSPLQLVIEVLVRLLVGAASGLIVILAIKGNLILGAINGSESPYLMYLLTMAAGWSEKFLPRFMGEIESKLKTTET